MTDQKNLVGHSAMTANISSNEAPAAARGLDVTISGDIEPSV